MGDRYFLTILIIIIPIIIAGFIMRRAQLGLDKEMKLILIEAFSSSRNFNLITYLILFVGYYLVANQFPAKAYLILFAFFSLFFLVGIFSSVRNFRKLNSLEVPEFYKKRYLIAACISKSGILAYSILLLFWYWGYKGNYSASEFEYKAYTETLAKNYQAAIADYTKAIKIDSLQSRMYYNRATTYYYMGNYSKACDDWKKAASLGDSTSVKSLEMYCK